jgi:hypothetical protein
LKKKKNTQQTCSTKVNVLTERVREILISVDFAALYFIAHDRKLKKVPREFFKL